jgi:hypothetical protein
MGWEQVTHAYYWKVFVSGLSLRAKAGFCYLFHLRWLLIFAAALSAVINPDITSPYVYPLMSWTMEFQVCVMTAVVLYGFVARNRYRWFGRDEACRAPGAELQERSLD